MKNNLKKIIFVLPFLSLLLFGAYPLEAKPPINGQSLQKYARQDPWQGFFKDPQVKNELKTLLGKNFNLFMDSLSQADFPEISDHVLFVSGTAKGLATVMEAAIGIDLDSGQFYSVLLVDGTTLKCFGPAKTRQGLPRPLQQWVSDLEARIGAPLKLLFN